MHGPISNQILSTTKKQINFILNKSVRVKGKTINQTYKIKQITVQHIVPGTPPAVAPPPPSSGSRRRNSSRRRWRPGKVWVGRGWGSGASKEGERTRNGWEPDGKPSHLQLAFFLSLCCRTLKINLCNESSHKCQCFCLLHFA